jgi:steroid 5-alpha reductase family enzyme
MRVMVLAVLVVMTAIMVLGWAFQRAARNGGWTDVFWTYGTGATCALAALAPFGAHAGVAWRRDLVAAMLVVWSLRLGTYVALRVRRSSEDVRYAELRREWGEKFQRNMFGLLIVQGPITAVIAIAVLEAARVADPGFRIQDGLGILVVIIAILGETVADRQMQAFKKNAANHASVCDKGLWGWSRHPNYFFEALIWFAYPIMALDPAHPSTLLSLGAPAMMIWIVRFGTGVPPLEKAMVQSKGDAYRRYQADVSTLVLRPPRRKAA